LIAELKNVSTHEDDFMSEEEYINMDNSALKPKLLTFQEIVAIVLKEERHRNRSHSRKKKNTPFNSSVTSLSSSSDVSFTSSDVSSSSIPFSSSQSSSFSLSSTKLTSLLLPQLISPSIQSSSFCCEDDYLGEDEDDSSSDDVDEEAEEGTSEGSNDEDESLKDGKHSIDYTINYFKTKRKRNIVPLGKRK
jgi:hypothetical protein